MKKIHHALLIVLATSIIACDIKERDGYSSDWIVEHTDYGERIHEMGRSCEWKSDSIELGITRFSARVGPNFYRDIDDEDADFYTITVEFDDGKSSIVLFERQLTIEELPDNYADLEASDIVAFDRESRIVSFMIGSERFSYQIPEPRFR